MFCKNCGSKLSSDSTSCPSCNAKVEVSNNFNNSNSLNTIDINSNYRKPSTTFIFITNLIMIVIFLVRAISIISMINEYRLFEHYNDWYISEIRESAITTLFFTIMSLIFTIIVFVKIVIIRKISKKNKAYKNSAITVLTGISIVLYLFYTLYTVILFDAFKNFFISLDFLEGLNFLGFYVDIFACLAIIVFAVVNLMKSKKITSHNTLNNGINRSLF